MKKTLMMKVLAGLMSAALTVGGAVGIVRHNSDNNIVASVDEIVAEENDAANVESSYNRAEAAAADGTPEVTDELIAKDQAGTVGKVEAVEAVETKVLASATDKAVKNTTTGKKTDSNTKADNTENKKDGSKDNAVQKGDTAQKKDTAQSAVTDVASNVGTDKANAAANTDKKSDANDQASDAEGKTNADVNADTGTVADNTAAVVKEETVEVADAGTGDVAAQDDSLIASNDFFVHGEGTFTHDIYVPPYEEPIVEEPVEETPSGPIGYRICNCGHTMDIYTYGLSDGEKAAWKEHMKEHLAKGEPTNYRDNAY